MNLDGTQAGGRISGKERIAGAGGEDHYLATLQVTHRLAAVVVVSDPDH